MDVFALVIACLVWWRYSRRANRLEAELLTLRSSLTAADDLIQQLIRRVYALENRPAHAVPTVEAQPMPEAVLQREAAVNERIQTDRPEPGELGPAETFEPAETVAGVETVEPESPPLPAFPPIDEFGWPRGEQSRPASASAHLNAQPEAQPPLPPPAPPRDWEALIGTSLLNAAGVLVLVIGISLLLGYTLTVMGPLGKVAIGISIGLVMIAGGIVIERRERFAIFGRGLIAGGWAALYFTTYAMYSLPAARIIESPLLAGVLLLTVATGLIAHSLRYRSQSLTLLAFATAFLALLLSPPTLLTIIASVPLTVALLVISRELGWTLVPVAGMLLAYLSFAFQYDAAVFGTLAGAGALYTYWICFETYDLLRLRSGAIRGYVDGAIFPLNIVLLFGVAMLTLPSSTPEAASNFLFSLGFLMLVSTALRMRWHVEPDPTDPEQRILAWSYRTGAAIAAALFAGSVLQRFDGYRAEIGLMLEAQLFVFAGIRLGDRFFARVGHTVFALAVSHAATINLHEGQRDWGIMTVCMAVQAYLNRWLTKADPLLTYAATALLASGAATLAPERWFGVAWLVIALVLAELYLRFNLTEFRYQTAALGALAVFVNLLLGIGDGAAHRNTVVTVETLSALLCYGIAIRLQCRDELLRVGASWGGTLLAACAIWTALPREFVALGWTALSAILLERGVRTESKLLRLQAHLLFLAAFAHVFLENLIPHGGTPAWPQLLTVAPLILLAVWGRYRTPESDPRVAYSWAAVLITVALVRRQFALAPTLACWAAIMVALSVLYRRFSLAECRFQSFFAGLLTYAGASFFILDANEPSLAVRLASIAPVIAAFHAVQFLCALEDLARGAFALAGSTLLSMLIYQESSGNLLTISWGAQAVLTLGAGFATRERLLRLTGLALFFICILKLFLYDLRELDTLGRILSFIVLGLVLIGASWLYMRFKNQIQKYL